jgi:hypothetical protein
MSNVFINHLRHDSHPIDEDLSMGTPVKPYPFKTRLFTTGLTPNP